MFGCLLLHSALKGSLKLGLEPAYINYRDMLILNTSPLLHREIQWTINKEHLNTTVGNLTTTTTTLKVVSTIQSNDIERTTSIVGTGSGLGKQHQIVVQ